MTTCSNIIIWLTTYFELCTDTMITFVSVICVLHLHYTQLFLLWSQLFPLFLYLQQYEIIIAVTMAFLGL